MIASEALRLSRRQIKNFSLWHLILMGKWAILLMTSMVVLRSVTNIHSTDYIASKR